MLLDNTLSTKNFIRISKDNNKIHYNKNFAKNFFFKKPIMHGVNIAIASIAKYLKFKKKKLFINQINIKFLDYCYEEDVLKYKISGNKITVYDDLSLKIIIKIDTSKKKINNNYKKIKTPLKKYNLQNISNIEILIKLFQLSKMVAIDQIGHGCMIHEIKINHNKIANYDKLKKKKIIKNLSKIEFSDGFYNSEITCSLLKKYKSNNKIIFNFKNKFNKKKILFFGATGDIAKILIKSLNSKNFRISKCSFKINKYNPVITNKIRDKIRNKIFNFQPDYIFYLSSPKIYNGSSKTLLSLYKKVYVNIFKLILNCLLKSNKKIKIFYPSSFAVIDNNYKKKIPAYIKMKSEAEKMSKLKKYKNFLHCYRLPQLKTSTNYNLLGFYEGKKISSIKNEILKFLDI